MGEFEGEVAVFTGAGSGFGRGAVLDYAQDHIRVNCVVAGVTDTPLLRNNLKACPGPDAEEKRIISTILSRALRHPKLSRRLCAFSHRALQDISRVHVWR